MLNSVNIDRNKLVSFCERWGIVELALFGSVLRSDFRDDSDIDVLVTFKPDAHIGLISLAKMESELSEMLGRKIDLVTSGGLKPQIREHILSEAEVLYAA